MLKITKHWEPSRENLYISPSPIKKTLIREQDEAYMYIHTLYQLLTMVDAGGTRTCMMWVAALPLCYGRRRCVAYQPWLLIWRYRFCIIRMQCTCLVVNNGRDYTNCTALLTLTVQNFWKFTSYCSLKPLWSGMGEVVPARTSPTLHPPSPPTVHQLSWLAL